MYKYSFLTFFIFLVFKMNAQPLPGKVYLKGSSELTGQFLTNEYDYGSSSAEVKTNQFNFQPSIGRFVSHHILIGIYTGYSYNKESEYLDDSEDNNYNKSTSLSIGPYIRGYLGESKLMPFIHGELGYSNYKIEQQVDSNSDIQNLKMNGINYELGIGIEYFIERKFSFEFLFNYHGLIVRGDITYDDMFGPEKEIYRITTKGFGLRIGTSIFLN